MKEGRREGGQMGGRHTEIDREMIAERDGKYR